MIITWLSPIFGKLSADAQLVGGRFYVPRHPRTDTPCLIPNEWLIHDDSLSAKPVENLFGLST